MVQELITVFAFAFHAHWSATSAKSLKAEIEALRAAGEPVLVSDFKPPEIAEKDNAKSDLLAAMEAFEGDSPAYRAIELADELPRLPLRADEIDHLKAITAENADTLRHLAAAAGKPHSNAMVIYKSPVLAGDLFKREGGPSVLAELRGMANFLRYTAVYEAHAGRHEKALQMTRQTRPLGEYAASHGLLIGHLISVGIYALQANVILELAPHLEIGPGGASPDAVKVAITELMVQDKIRQQRRYGFVVERMCILDSSDAMKRGQLAVTLQMNQPGSALQRYALAPLIDENAVMTLRYVTGIIGYLEAPDEPTFQQSADPDWRAWERRLIVGWPRTIFARTLAPGVNRAGRSAYRAMTAREAAAAALAVRWYAVDHNGQLPAKLEDLVPAYLPRLPRDYQADNQPLKYRAGQDAILWSVGEDGIDSGGRERDPTKSAAEERGKYDEVFPLTARPRKAAN